MFGDPWKITAAQQALLDAGQQHRIKAEAYRQAWIAGEVWLLQHPDEAKKAKKQGRQRRRTPDEYKQMAAKNKAAIEQQLEKRPQSKRRKKDDGPPSPGG